MTNQELIDAIDEHPILHDLLSHLSAFGKACEIAADSSYEDDDSLYWTKQEKTVKNIQDFLIQVKEE
jgi:hypothetical protein